MLCAVDRNDFGAAVTVATMVQVAGLAAVESCVDDLHVVDPEHVAVTEASLLVLLFADVSHFIVDNLTDVLDDDVVLLQVFTGEKPNTVDLRRADLDFPRHCHRLSILHGHWKVRLADLL